MSCYEWERGELKIPTAEWAGLKRAIRETFNQVGEQQFSYAEKVYAYFAARQDRPGFDYDQEWRKIEFGNVPELDPQNPWERDLCWRICDYRQQRVKRPLKKEFLPANADTVEFSLGEVEIHFDKERHTVVWSVADNNRACSKAREHPVGIAFFHVLARIKWTRGSGGTIVGNDEYHRDSTSAGGGANYIKQRFGPLGAAEGKRSLPRVPRKRQR